jgi:hypothetical protein
MNARVVLAVLAVLTLGACDAAISSIDQTCLSDSECGGSVCAFGYCVDPSALGVVDVEVEPAGGSLPVQSVLSVDTNAADRVDVQVRSAVPVSGFVDDAAVPDAGDFLVYATPSTGIAGRLRQRVTTTSLGSFSMQLVSNQPYRLSALAADAQAPPTLSDAVFIAGVQAVPQLVVTAGPHVRGQLVAGVGAGAVGLDGFSVVVVDEAGRQLSSVDTTLPFTGAFDVQLAAGVDVAFLAVHPPAGAEGLPEATVPLTPIEVADVELGDVLLAVDASRVAVRGAVLNAAGNTVDDAVVTLRGAVGLGVVTANAVTNNGTFTALLLPGRYDVAVVGSSGSAEDGLVFDAIDVVANMGELQFTLAPRVSVGLRVRNSSDVDVARASVELTRVGDVDGVVEPVLAAAQAAFVGEADDNGRVSLSVDPGRYRVTIEPPRGSDVPAYSGLLVVDGDLNRTITLPAARVLAGALVDDRGAPVGGAWVRVYAQLVDEGGRALLLGEAVSGSDGAFAVSVPDFGSGGAGLVSQ